MRHITPGFHAIAVAAMALDVFTPLGSGPMTPDELATALGVPSRRLPLLLRSLTATGLVVGRGDRFANSAVADEFLVRYVRFLGGGNVGKNDRRGRPEATVLPAVSCRRPAVRWPIPP